MAGTSGDKRAADYVYDQWKSQGLDNVQMVDYDVLLDYPHEIKYNRFFDFKLRIVSFFVFF